MREMYRHFWRNLVNPLGGYINGGIYLFESTVMSLVPDGHAVSLEKNILPGCSSGG